MKHHTQNQIIYEGDKCENERYEVQKIDNGREKIDDEMMNLPKSLHDEDMSSIDEIMNDTDSKPLGED